MQMRIDRDELIGILILSLGMVFLILTFYMAFLFLIQELNIITHSDLVKSLGEILGPIAEAIIRIMFLGIMGWIGSLTTVRGMQFLRIKESPEVKPVPQPPSIQAPPELETPRSRKEEARKT
jgi:hypothetical protein